MKTAPALLAFCLCCAPLVVARAQTSTTIEASPRAGEIMLEGRVAALGAGQFTLKVTAFTNPNGNRSVLAAPKNKTIFIDNAPDLKTGETIFVVGINSAASLKARAIVRIGGAPQKAAQPAAPPIAATSPAINLPPTFAAGDLKITPVQAGFDYSTNVFPGYQTFERTPVFTCTFEVKSGGAKLTEEEISKSVMLRRIVGPQNQFVAPFSLNISAMRVKEQANKIGFANAGVDPNWDWIDVDLDVISAPEKTDGSGGTIELKDVELPAPGAEIPVDREFTGTLGTKFRVIKIKRDDKGWTQIVVHHQKPAAPTDLEITGYKIKTISAKNNANSGGGGLSNGLADSGDNELLLSADKNLASLSSLRITMEERAPSLANRSRVTRERLRYDLKRLRASEKIVPVEFQNAPVELGRASTGEVEVRAESDGLSWSGNSAMLLMAAKSAPTNEQRGLRWNIANGRALFDNGAPDAEVQTSSGAMIYLWHSDGTPLAPGETIEKRSIKIPAGAKSYDLKLEMEGRVTLEEWFAREIEIPRDQNIVTPTDDEERGLILRKIQRFSGPDELANYPQWIRGQWPNAGYALVFEANPQLISPEFFAYCYDAEDDKGRPLKTGTLIEQSLYNMDMTDAKSQFRQSKFHTLIVGKPAPDAKSFKVWLRSSEQASNVDKVTLEMKNIAVTKFDK